MADYTLKARLTADAKEFISGLNRAKSELNGLQKFSINVGNKLKGFGDRIGSIGDSLTNKITKPAVAAGTAIAGITLVKGFQRLVGIDTAQAKLKALGHDAKSVDNIMESALASVKGTSYGLGEAATTAASAVAAGIEPGKELTRYLTLTGDAAAIAGAGMDEMGSIFNKITTSNKAYNGELQQLSDRGIPIYQYLAEEAGVTEDAITKMASEGKITSDMFLKAIEKNIGGAAGIMGAESFTAGLANMWAAVGRLGASFLDAGGKGGGFFSTLKPLMADFTKKIDSMGDIAEKAGVKFGEMFTGFIEKVKEVKQQWDELDPRIQDVIKKVVLFGSIGAVSLGPILKILSPIVTVFGFLGTSVIPKLVTAFNVLRPAIALLTGPVGIVIGVITGLIALFVYLYKTNEEFREKVNEVWSVIKETIQVVVEAISSFVMDIFGQLVTWWNENNELIMETASTIWNTIQDVISDVMSVVVPLLKVAWTSAKTTVMLIWNQMKTAIEIAINLILGIVKVVMQAINGDWEGAWNTVKETATKLWGIIKKSILNIVNILKGNLSDYFIKIKDAIVNKIIEAKDNLVNKFTEMKTNVSNKAEEIIGTAKEKFEEVKNKILEPIENAKKKISEVIDDIKGFFTNMKLKIPKIEMPKLPKFSLKGKFSFMPPSVPKIGVNKHAPCYSDVA